MEATLSSENNVNLTEVHGSAIQIILLFTGSIASNLA
jgi:hypothetical protein